MYRLRYLGLLSQICFWLISFKRLSKLICPLRNFYGHELQHITILKTGKIKKKLKDNCMVVFDDPKSIISFLKVRLNSSSATLRISNGGEMCKFTMSLKQSLLKGFIAGHKL